MAIADFELQFAQRDYIYIGIEQTIIGVRLGPILGDCNFQTGC